MNTKMKLNLTHLILLIIFQGANSIQFKTISLFKTVTTGTRFKHHTKVIVGRHPFNRLISTYRDKIGPRDHQDPVFDPITKKIIGKYRERNATASGRTCMFIH